MKVAIVHDWLTNRHAGATKVVIALHDMFPDAPIYTSVHKPGSIPELENATIITSFIQKIPFLKYRHQLVPQLRQVAFERFDFSQYDLVISSSGSEAKGIITSEKTMHINYCHSPTHYYWKYYDEYMKNPGFGIFNPLARIWLRLWISSLRTWDYEAAKRPDHMIANSTHIQKEIKDIYNRTSTVIHPPVNLTKKSAKRKKRTGLLVLGRQVRFKKMELAVQACSELGIDLTVAGDGPEHANLRSIAGPTVSFIQNVSDEKKQELLAGAEGFIMCNEEDFGIVMVEALAAGTPVISLDAGGAKDILNTSNSKLFTVQSVDSLKKAISQAQKQKWDHAKISQSATKFNTEVFETKLKLLIAEL